MNNKLALVLEGGGFRGLYTAGILHACSENNVTFPNIVAVSMGASNATNFLANQSKRNLDVPFTYITDKRYMSYSRLLTKGELFGMDFIFDEVANKLIPFDYETFALIKSKLTIVTTDCKSGEPYFVDNKSVEDAYIALEASTSLPFVAKIVKLHGRLLLDGGISDPIPLEKAIKDGANKLVVILTQPKGYRKTPFKGKWLMRLKYKVYPKLIKSILERHLVYNNQLALLEKLEAEGKAFVIRPIKKLPISRTEKNKYKLKEAFELGHQQGLNIMDDLLDFMQ